MTLGSAPKELRTDLSSYHVTTCGTASCGHAIVVAYKTRTPNGDSVYYPTVHIVVFPTATDWILSSAMDHGKTADAGESRPSARRMQRLYSHLSPADPRRPSIPPQLRLQTCARVKLEVDTEKLSTYMRGKYRELQEKVYEYFNSRPDLQTPLEISKDDHRELCMRQLLGLVREAGIRPFGHVFDDPGKYFAILEAVGSVDMSLGIKMGVQYR